MSKKKKENDVNNHPSDGTVANIKWCVWCGCGYPINEKCKTKENVNKFWERSEQAFIEAFEILNKKR
jgi:hypothetical protein